MEKTWDIEHTKVKFCPNCKAIRDWGAIYCDQCAGSLVVACSKCKKEIPNDTDYCPWTGEQLIQSS